MNIIPENTAKIPDPRSENPDPIDVHVGLRLRMRRNLLGISQKQLGKFLGLTFQQIQKYERGINRMGASRLFQISKVLSVPVAYFFEDMPMSIDLWWTRKGFTHPQGAAMKNFPTKERHGDGSILCRRETLELIRAYYHIEDTKQRRKILDLIRSLSDQASC